MEQIFKYFVSRRQAHFLSAVQQNCLANSNCLHVASGMNFQPTSRVF